MNVQLVPEPFVEISENGEMASTRSEEKVKVSSIRGELHRESDGHEAHLKRDDDRR